MRFGLCGFCRNVSLVFLSLVAWPALALTTFDWLVVPIPFSDVQTVPVGNGLLTIMRSGYIDGVYPIDLNDDGTADGTLTADVELISAVLFDGLTYNYQWQLSNLGSGALVGFLGLDTPGFTISLSTPLYGIAGPDRIVGTADDLTVQMLQTSTNSIHAPGSEAWGITVNPSTGLGAPLLAPLVAPEPDGLALVGAALGLMLLMWRPLLLRSRPLA